MMSIRLALAVLVIATLLPSLTAPAFAQARINASLLPASRFVQTGDAATAFATIINPGSETALNCTLVPVTTVPAGFEVFRTDPATNAILSPAQTSADIAAGGLASFVFAFTPTSGFDPVDVEIGFDCDNTDPARVIPGVNTFLLGASDVPGPDIVALAATLANDGVTRSPGPAGTAVFSVATSNVGAAGTLTATPVSTDPDAGVTLRICETDPVLGTCLAPPSANVSVTAGANGINSFGIFVRASQIAPLAPATRRIALQFTDAQGRQRGATSVAFTTQTEMAGNGGTLRFDGAEASLEPDFAIAPVDVAVTDLDSLPAPLPAGAGTPERMRTIEVSDVTRLNAPLGLSLTYDDTGLDEDNLLVLHYDADSGAYQVATVLGLDRDANRINIAARDFSPYVTLPFIGTVPALYTASGFDPAVDSWNIENFGNYFNSGGNCLGMSAYAVWWFNTHVGQSMPLSAQYSNAGGAPASIAHLVAARAMLAQNQYWAWLDQVNHARMSDADFARMLQNTLYMTGQPQTMLLQGANPNDPVAPNFRHAVVVYGWDTTGFLIYEVNTQPGSQRGAVIPFNFQNYDAGFGTYNGYDTFGFVTQPSLGRGEDFARLHQDAAAGFPQSDLISIASPTPNQIVTDRVHEFDIILSGIVADRGEATLVMNGSNEMQLGSSDRISRLTPVQPGGNTAVVIAGVDGNSAEQTGFWNWVSDGAGVVVRDFSGNFNPSPINVSLSYRGDDYVYLFMREASSPSVVSIQWQASLNGLRWVGERHETPNYQQIILDDVPHAEIGLGYYYTAIHHFEGDGASGTLALNLHMAGGQWVRRSYRFTFATEGDSRFYGQEHMFDDPVAPAWVRAVRFDMNTGVIEPW